MRLTAWSVLFILALASLEPLLAQSPNSGSDRFGSGSQSSPYPATGRGCPCRNQSRLPARVTLVPTPVALSWTESWRTGMHRFLGRLIGNAEEVETSHVGNTQRRVDARWTRLRGRAIFKENQPPTTQVPTRSQRNRSVTSASQVWRPSMSITGTERSPVIRWVAAPEREHAPRTVAVRRQR